MSQAKADYITNAWQTSTVEKRATRCLICSVIGFKIKIPNVGCCVLNNAIKSTERIRQKQKKLVNMARILGLVMESIKCAVRKNFWHARKPITSYDSALTTSGNIVEGSLANKMANLNQKNAGFSITKR